MVEKSDLITALKKSKEKWRTIHSELEILAKEISRPCGMCEIYYLNRNLREDKCKNCLARIEQICGSKSSTFGKIALEIHSALAKTIDIENWCERKISQRRSLNE